MLLHIIATLRVHKYHKDVHRCVYVLPSNQLPWLHVYAAPIILKLLEKPSYDISHNDSYQNDSNYNGCDGRAS